MTVEQRLDQLEKRNKRLTVALTMTVVAMCAVVTMAATSEKYSNFDTVAARTIYVLNDAGEIVVSLGANDDDDGSVETYSAKGKKLVALTSTVEGNGAVATYHPNGNELVTLSANPYGGLVWANPHIPLRTLALRRRHDGQASTLLTARPRRLDTTEASLVWRQRFM